MRIKEWWLILPKEILVMKGGMRNNFYLQVPILSEGEEGFVLGWDESFDFWELKEREEIYGYDLFYCKRNLPAKLYAGACAVSRISVTTRLL